MTAMASTAKVAQSCRRCRKLTRNGVYCPACEKIANRAHQNPAYARPEWRQFRARVIAEHIRRFGPMCPGYGNRSPHPSNDLTVDHPIALARGGELIQADAKVYCRSCNSAKGVR